jgi:hypothetical protein
MGSGAGDITTTPIIATAALLRWSIAGGWRLVR